jgi:hypothetical protein
MNNYDYSDYWQGGTFTLTQELVESTQMQDTAHEWVFGFHNSELSINGYQDAYGALTPDWFIGTASALYGKTDIITTICPTDGTDGEYAYSTKHAITQYSPISGNVGEMCAYSLTSGGAYPAYQTSILKNAITNVTAGGTGTPYQLGLCDTGSTLHCIIHCHALNGGTLDIGVFSDDAEGMPSSLERGAFTNLVAGGSEWVTVAGDDAWGDDWWRVEWTFNGTSCKFIVLMAIV